MEEEHSLDSNGGDVFSVEKILDTKFLDDKLRIYKVRWEGYGSGDDTWEPEDHLITCHNLLKDFWDKKKLAARLAKQDRKKKRSKKLARKLIDNDVLSSATASRDTSSVDNSSCDEGFEKLVSETASDKKTKLSKPKWTEIKTAVEESWLVDTVEKKHKKKKKHKRHDETREVSKTKNNPEKQLTIKPDSASQEVFENKTTEDNDLSAIKKEKSGSESSNKEHRLSLKMPVESGGNTGFQIVSDKKTSEEFSAIKEEKHHFEASSKKDKALLKTPMEGSKSVMQKGKGKELLDSDGRSTGFSSATPKKIEMNMATGGRQEASHEKTVKEEVKISGKQSNFTKDLKMKLSIGIRKENRNSPIQVLSDSSSSESSSTESEGDREARSLMAKWRNRSLGQSPSQSQSSVGRKSLMKRKDGRLRVSYEETKGRNLMQRFKEDESMKLKSGERKDDLSTLSPENIIGKLDQMVARGVNEASPGNVRYVAGNEFASTGKDSVKISESKQKVISERDSRNVVNASTEIFAVSASKTDVKDRGIRQKETSTADFGISEDIVKGGSNMSAVSAGKRRHEGKTKNPIESLEEDFGIESCFDSNLSDLSREKGKIQSKETRPKEMNVGRKMYDAKSNFRSSETKLTENRETNVGIQSTVDSNLSTVSIEKVKMKSKETGPKEMNEKISVNVANAGEKLTAGSTGEDKVKNVGAKPKGSDGTKIAGKAGNVEGMMPIVSAEKAKITISEAQAKQSSDRKIENVGRAGLTPSVSTGNVTITKQEARPKDQIVTKVDPHVISKTSNAAELTEVTSSLVSNSHAMSVNSITDIIQQGMRDHDRNLAFLKEKRSTVLRNFDAHSQIAKPDSDILNYVPPVKDRKDKLKVTDKEVENPFANVYESRAFENVSPVKERKDSLDSPNDKKHKDKQLDNPFAKVYENIGNISPSKGGRDSPKLQDKEVRASENLSPVKGGRDATKAQEKELEKKKTASESLSEKKTASESLSEKKTASESLSEKKTASESLSGKKETASESLSEEKKTASEPLSAKNKTASESLPEKNKTASESLSDKNQIASESPSGKEKPRSESPSERRRSLIKIGKSDIVKQLAKIGSVVGSGKFARSLAQIKASSGSRDSSDEDVSKTEKGKKIKELEQSKSKTVESDAWGTRFEQQKQETLMKKEAEIASEQSFERTVEAQGELAGIADKTFSKLGVNKDISPVVKGGSDTTLLTDNLSAKQDEPKCNIDDPNDNTNSTIFENSSENPFQSKEVADKPTEIVSSEAQSILASKKGEATKSRVGKETLEQENTNVLADGQAKPNAKPDNILREKAKRSDKIAAGKSKVTAVPDNNLRLEFTKVATLKSDQSKSSLKRPMEGGSASDNKVVKKNKLDPSKARYANKRQLSKEAFVAPKNDILGDILGRNNQMLRSIDDRMEEKQRNNESKGSDKELNDLYEPISDVDFDLDLEEFHDDDGLFLSDDDSGYMDHVSVDDVIPLQMSQEEYLKAFCTGVYETILGGIAAGMDPDCWDSSNGGTPLWSAIEDDRYDVAKKLLKLGSNPNYRAENGKTALMVAVEGGKFGFVSMLLRAGAHINLQQHNGETALILACRKGHEDVINLLLNYGADTKITPASFPKPVAEYSPEYQILLIKRIIDRHTERLKTMSEMALKQCLNAADDIVQPPVLSCRCISPDEKTLHDIYFKCEHFAGEKGTIILLLCLGAQFTPSGEIKLLLNNKDNGIEAVILNKEHQIPVYETNHSMYFLFPNVGQLNSLCLRTHKTGFKMLVSIYAVKTDKNWIDNELETFYREFQMYQLACNQEIS